MEFLLTLVDYVFAFFAFVSDLFVRVVTALAQAISSLLHKLKPAPSSSSISSGHSSLSPHSFVKANRSHFRTKPVKQTTERSGLVYAVTGGHGFLGSHVVEALLARGDRRIRIIDLPFTASNPLFQSEFAETLKRKQATASSGADNEKVNDDAMDVSFIGLDLVKDGEKLAEALEDVDVVIHTAAAVSFSSRLAYDFEPIHRVNVVGCKNLLHACSQSKQVRFVVSVSSSTAVLHGIYSPFSMYSPSASSHAFRPRMNEEQAILPSSYQHSLCHYTATKLEGEKVVLNFNMHLNSSLNPIRTLCIRPGGIFGPRDAIFGALIHEKEVPSLGSTGLQDFIYVENVAYALLCSDAALRKEAELDHSVSSSSSSSTFKQVAPTSSSSPVETNSVSGEAYFVMSGEEWRYNDFCNAMGNAWGYQRPIIPMWAAWILAWFAEFIQWVGQGKIPIGRLALLTPPCLRIAEIDCIFNDEKARTKLGYRPPYTVKEAIGLTIGYWKEFRGVTPSSK